MVTAAGSGYSRWNELAVTRWREDATRDDWGSYIFLRDVESGRVWSAGYQPCATEPESYDVTFTEDRAEIARTDEDYATRLKIVVSPEEDTEVRHLAITNTGHRSRDVEVTSCTEIALAPPAADAAHPAFSKLFVQTEFDARIGALIATRRKRAPDESGAWVGHQAVVEGDQLGPLEYETDRLRFLGRGHETRAPIAMLDGRRLTHTVGTVLDPMFALRCRLRVPAGATVRVAFWTVAASSRQEIVDLLDKHQDPNAFGRASTLAWTQAQVQLRHLAITPAEAALFQRLAGHVLFADASLRPSSGVIRRGGATPSVIWSLGVSGDLPIVLLRIDDLDDIAIARQLLQAHEYWRMKQLAVDLVILNDRGASYERDLQSALEALHRVTQSRGPIVPNLARGSGVTRRGASCPATGPAPGLRRRRAGAAGPAFLQRPRRVQRGRQGIRSVAGPGTSHAGALDQRDRQSFFRVPGGSRRRRLHLVAEQPREPADGLVERSGHGSARRYALRT
jgi:cyclic beta-1,2-glucan synthetase